MASAAAPKKCVRFSKRGEPLPFRRSQALCTRAVAWKVSPDGSRAVFMAEEHAEEVLAAL